MCTAISYKAKDFYFGRTLDYESSYGEEVVITPRHYQFSYAHMGECTTHYAMIGMAHVAEEYPLYYEAVNEKGLGMAGLNFVGNACYGEYEENAKNVATYEFIPWVLGACESVEQVRDYLIGLNLMKSSRSPWRWWKKACKFMTIRLGYLPTIRLLTSRCFC